MLTPTAFLALGVLLTGLQGTVAQECSVVPSTTVDLGAATTTTETKATFLLLLWLKRDSLILAASVDTNDNLIRGRQMGYNICNSTTEGQSSMCQTAFVNSIEDFCIWSAADPDSVVGDVEGHMVAWCTKPGHGTRVIPANTLTGIQFVKTKSYVSIVGFLKQENVNLLDGDYGGEMDPHGADLRGNPIGGILFSNAFSGNNDTYTQTIEWHLFIGKDKFCFKACDPADPNAAHYCEHIYDRIGCDYNAPSNAQNNVFESCEGENQYFPGVYTSDGVVMTYTQPPESLGVISTLPYVARVPASSNCVQFQSTRLYAAAATVFPTKSSGVATAGSGFSTGVKTTGTRGATATGTAANSTGGDSSAATVLETTSISLVSIIVSALAVFSS